jgi:hypothetical protein
VVSGGGSVVETLRKYSVARRESDFKFEISDFREGEVNSKVNYLTQRAQRKAEGRGDSEAALTLLARRRH